jgi:hypothetical protein
VTNADVNSRRFNEKMDSLQSYLSARKIPSSLSFRIRTHFKHLLLHKTAIDEQSILDALSPQVRHRLPLRPQLPRHASRFRRSPIHAATGGAVGQPMRPPTRCSAIHAPTRRGGCECDDHRDGELTVQCARVQLRVELSTHLIDEIIWNQEVFKYLPEQVRG